MAITRDLNISSSESCAVSEEPSEAAAESLITAPVAFWISLRTLSVTVEASGVTSVTAFDKSTSSEEVLLVDEFSDCVLLVSTDCCRFESETWLLPSAYVIPAWGITLVTLLDDVLDAAKASTLEPKKVIAAVTDKARSCIFAFLKTNLQNCYEICYIFYEYKLFIKFCQIVSHSQVFF